MMGGSLRGKACLLLHHVSQTILCGSASFSEKRMSRTAAIWVLLSVSILLSPLTPGQAAFPWCVTRVDCDTPSKNSITHTGL